MGTSRREGDEEEWPAVQGNPLLEFHQRSLAADDLTEELRDELTHRYAFAICDDNALSLLGDASPAGIVELGAGTGYWARLLHERGVDVVAFDIAPPPSAANRWFAGQPAWYTVQRGDETFVGRFAERTLLLVWPTRNEVWPATALETFHAAGGETVAYVGQGPGGRTGDDRFLAMLGAYERCYACAYDLHDSPCICGTPVLWRKVFATRLPSWPGQASELEVFRRAEQPLEVVEREPARSRRAARLSTRIRSRWPRLNR
jgi:hypothetical protein